MRIDAYNQVSRIYNATKKTNVNKAGKIVLSDNDRLEISQSGKDYQIAKNAVASAPDVREDRVAEVKAKYESGNYNVSPEELVAKLVEKYNTLAF